MFLNKYQTKVLNMRDRTYVNIKKILKNFLLTVKSHLYKLMGESLLKNVFLFSKNIFSLHFISLEQTKFQIPRCYNENPTCSEIGWPFFLMLCRNNQYNNTWLPSLAWFPRFASSILLFLVCSHFAFIWRDISRSSGWTERNIVVSFL